MFHIHEYPILSYPFLYGVSKRLPTLAPSHAACFLESAISSELLKLELWGATLGNEHDLDPASPRLVVILWQSRFGVEHNRTECNKLGT
jgi:hypothetical protein